MASPAADPLRRAMQLDALEQQLHPYLPPGLADHCRLANVAGGRLVFVVDAPVWQARLRLASNELIEAARSIGLTVTAVTARTTLQPLFPNAADEPPKPGLTPTARAALQEALSMLEDSPASETSDSGTGRHPVQQR